MVEYLGNKALLERPMTAFLAPTVIAPASVLRCYDWAAAMAREGRTVVSGFSSTLERDVLHFLAKGSQPIVMVMGRRIYRRLPPELEALLDANRLLLIAINEQVRLSRATAAARNRYLCALAAEVVMASFDRHSSLLPLYQELRAQGKPVTILGNHRDER